MKSITMTVGLGMLVVLPGAAMAAETATVQSLLSQQFAVVGTINTASGMPGVFLQKKDQLFVCFISETSQSTAVSTRYCKPVE
jgi:hypothetical protein